MKLIGFLLFAGAVLAQTTNYPGAVDNDASLFVVKDNIQTSLNVAMAAADTTAVVASSTGFLPNMIATICDTSTSTGKCTAWEHMLVTAVSGNVLTVTRGFAGTTARTHSTGRLVSVLIDSAHQKVLKDSVVAIESALGPNLKNVPLSPLVTSTNYSFTPYSCNSSSVCVPGGPGGMGLIAGNNTLIMTPVPSGVNGVDTGHDLYVSGGTGTAEACRITGGSGTSGAASGQIIVNCANTHSGAWTIQSGTNGITEAKNIIKAAGQGGQVYVPPGIYTQCGTFVSDTPGILIAGSGSNGTGWSSNVGIVKGGGTTIQPCFANQTLFSVANGLLYTSTATFLSVRDIGFYNNGLAGVKAISVVRDTGGLYENLSFSGITNVFYGLYFDRTAEAHVSHIMTFGTAVGFFGSSVDTDPIWNYAGSTNLLIDNWTGVTQANVGAPIITIQGCIVCSFTNINLYDPNISVTNTGIAVLNHCEGTVLENLFLGEMSIGVNVLQTTVGTTTAAPGETSIINAQIDCAGGAGTGCANNSFIGIALGANSYNTSIINPIMTSPGGSNNAAQAIQVNGNSLAPLQFMARIMGGQLAFTGAYQILVNAGTPPPNGLTVTGTTFELGGGIAVLLGPGAALNNLVFTGNYVMNGTPFLLNSGASITKSYVTGNLCATDPAGQCNGAFGPAVNRDTAPAAYASLPSCVSSLAGTRATVTDSTANTWGAAVGGGGANMVLAFCNGTSWTVAGK